MELGWGGPLHWKHMVPWLIIAAVLFVVWHILKKRGKAWSTLFLVVANMFAGFGLGMATWCVFSNIYCQEVAKAPSFQWLGLPSIVCYTIVGTVWLTFGKVQPKEKYAGLTLFDKSDIIADESEN